MAGCVSRSRKAARPVMPTAGKRPRYEPLHRGRVDPLEPSKGRRSVMNPINVWPLLGDHPSWCYGWLCTRTKLGHEHRSAPTYLTLGDDRCELSQYRVDEPTAGESQIRAVVTDGKCCRPPVELVFPLADADELIEHLTELTEQARAESTAPVLEVVR